MFRERIARTLPGALMLVVLVIMIAASLVLAISNFKSDHALAGIG